MRGEPDDFWGKLERDEAGRVLAWNPVEAHCADVAACCEALLRDTMFGRRMARLAGQETLHPILLDRLTVLAALHDLGKYAISFQNRPYPHRQPQGGHVEPIVQALSSHGALTTSLLELLAPLEAFGESWDSYLAASISHHGRPEKIGVEGSAAGFDPTVFAPARGLVPIDGMRRLLDLTRQWCPRAFQPAPQEAQLPDRAAVQHFFAGVVMLGDWLGSDTKVFAYADTREDPMPRARSRAREIVQARFLAPNAWRAKCRTDFGVFDGAAGPFTPRPAQEAVDGLPLPPHERASLTVLEAETGSGKTEAAIHRFSQLFRGGLVDGLYFALPTRTSATQIHRRVVAAVASTFSDLPKDEQPPVILAVPGYLQVDDATGQALPHFEFLWPDRDQNRHRTWAAENTKRFLAGCIVIGTIDQVLLSTLVVSHAHLRATALARLFLVVDEVHASDAYMTTLLDRVLAFHLACGGHAMLMSATLGTVAQERYFARLALASPLDLVRRRAPASLADAERVPYPAVHHAEHRHAKETQHPSAPGNAKLCEAVLVAEIDEPLAVAARALSAARRGALVLVLRNTVSDAVGTQRALESIATEPDRRLLFEIDGQPTLHHARFVDGDRRLLDAAVEERLGKHASRSVGAVVVATQTVQQSLDLDADLLITDLCPMDVLLQRIGRLHRHVRPPSARPEGFRAARCEVLDPGSLAAMLDERGEVRARHGFGSVYDDLRVLEATRSLLLSHPRLAIPDDNRMLVERTTHPEALEAVARTAGRAMEAHGQSVEGASMFHRQLAAGHSVDRSKRMGEYGFPSRETSGRITTRLGEEDRLLELAEPFTSPFGTRVRTVKVPHWLARTIPAEPVTEWLALEPVSPGGGVRLRVKDSTGTTTAVFVYDRLGLRADEPTAKEELADE